MNVTVVHDNDRIRSWIRLHFVQGALNEAVKALCVERAFENVTVNNTLGKGQSW